jgi:hypothetical protein
MAQRRPAGDRGSPSDGQDTPQQPEHPFCVPGADARRPGSQSFLPFRDPHGQEVLEVNPLLVPHGLATRYMRVRFHGLRSHGVLDGDLLAIDRLIAPWTGLLVVLAQRGEFLLPLLLP